MLVLDISRAHFYGEARRRVFTILPEVCAMLQKTMYDTEDAVIYIYYDKYKKYIY